MSTTTTALPLPGFYAPAGVADLARWIDYDAIQAAAIQYRKDYDLRPTATDRKKVGLLLIDMQVTFCHPDAELSVQGAVEDAQRVAEFIYRNAGTITRIYCTLDTHRPPQVFHPDFFEDDDGNPPPPYTIITRQDLLDGKWKASPWAASALGNKLMANEGQLLDYVTKLESRGRYPLMVWPYHAMLGSKGYALMPGIEEASFFHQIARGSLTHFETKGTSYYAENYSALGAEVTTLVNGVGIPRATGFIDALLSCDYLFVAGEAKSHCLAWTIADFLDEVLKGDRSLAEKVYLMEDGTSPVITPAYDFTTEGDEAFDRFRAAGMHVVKSTDPIEDWKGIEL